MKEKAVLSLIQIDSEDAIKTAYKRLPFFDAGLLVLRSLAAKARPDLIRGAIAEGATDGSNSTLKRITNFLLYVTPEITIDALMYFVNNDVSEKTRVFVLIVFGELYKNSIYVGRLGNTILDAIQRFLLSPSMVEALAALDAIFQIRHHISITQSISYYEKAIGSKNDQVRMVAAEHLAKVGGSGREVIKQALQTERNFKVRRSMERNLRKYEYIDRLESTPGPESCVFGALNVSIKVIFLLGVGVFFAYILHKVNPILAILFGCFLPVFLPVFDRVISEILEKRYLLRFIIFLTLILSIAIFIIIYNDRVSMTIIRDNFEDPNYSLWDVSNNIDGAWRGYENGRLSILVTEPNTTVWVPLQREYLQNFELSIEASVVAGPADNLFGVIFLYQNTNNFYYFAISGNGYCYLFKNNNSVWETVFPETPVSLDLSRILIRMVIDEGNLTAFIDGRQIISLFDSNFRIQGSIALAAGTYYSGGVHISYDNMWMTFESQ